MLIKIQKPTRIFAIGFLFIILFGACVSLIHIQTAQAQTFEQHIPSFGLFCKDKEVIRSGAIKYDLSNGDTVTKRKGIMQSNYQLTAVNRTVEFSIPFIASAENIPSFSVIANGQKINGSICYGDSFSSEKYTDFETLIDKTYSPIINENLNGTLYTITPDNETITIELLFAEGKNRCFIYETSNNLMSSVSTNGTFTWTFNNAYTNEEYKIFIIGENSDFSFSCSSNYQSEIMTCKEFIDSQYEYLKELYDLYGVNINFLYSMVNNVLQNKQSINYDDLFFHSMSTQRFNVYKFSLHIDTTAATLYR